MRKVATPHTIQNTIKRFSGNLFSLLAFQYMYAQLFTNTFFRHLEALHREPYQAATTLLSADINKHLGIDSAIYAIKTNPSAVISSCNSLIQPGANFLAQQTTDMKHCLQARLTSITQNDAQNKKQILQAVAHAHNLLISLFEDLTSPLTIPGWDGIKSNYETSSKSLLASQQYLFQQIEAFTSNQKTIQQRVITLQPKFSSVLSSLASAYVENRWLIAGALAATTLVSYLAYRSITAYEKTKKPEDDSTETSLAGSAINYFCMSLPLLLVGYSLYALTDTPDESSLNRIVFTQLAAASMLLTSLFATTASYISNRSFKAKQQKVISATHTELLGHGLETTISKHITTGKDEPTNAVKVKLISFNGEPLSKNAAKKILTQCTQNQPTLRHTTLLSNKDTLIIDIQALTLLKTLIIAHINQPAKAVAPSEPPFLPRTVTRQTGTTRRKTTGAARSRRSTSLFPTAAEAVTATATQHSGRFPASFTFKQGAENYTAHHVEGTINMYVAFTLQPKNHHENEKNDAFKAAVESSPTMGTSIRTLKTDDSAIEVRATGHFGDFRCICRAEDIAVPGHPDLGPVPLYISDKIVRHAALKRTAVVKSSGPSQRLG
ncbi:MAG: hypothetical protein P1U34_10755 [Coxiellaceae bacterium]|nr:hypothetical protein [Coxiellaceae bacterium]